MNPGDPAAKAAAGAEEREPTRDQLLAMAYCDGELEADAHAEFEARLASEPALLAEVSELRGLEVLARRVAPPEPGDFVRERLAREPLQRGGTTLAFGALIAALALGAAFLCWALLADDELPTALKATIALGAGGITLLFLVVLRQRLALLPHDPYRHVER